MPFPHLSALTAILGALCLAPAPVAAQASAERLEVTGVAADDVLNLRAEPRARAALTGALAPAASGIEAMRRTENWVYVKFRDREGWAAARHLRPAETYEDGRPPLPLQCIGTEPFWSVAIDADRATWRTPETEETVSEIRSIERSRNSTVVWQVRAEDGPVASVTIEARQACSDNMSDRVYPFRAHVQTRDGALLSGCCATK